MGRQKRSIEFRLTIVIEPDGDEFHAYCPALKGLHTSGKSQEEARQNAVDAAIGYLESMIKHNEPIPIGVAAPAKPATARLAEWTGQVQVAVA